MKIFDENMPVYKCPVCGKTVEKKQPGKYYCLLCTLKEGEKIWMQELTPVSLLEKPPPLKPPLKPEEIKKPPPPPPHPAVQALIKKHLIEEYDRGKGYVDYHVVGVHDWDLHIYEDKTFNFSIGDYWGPFYVEHYQRIKKIIDTLQLAGFKFE